MTTTGRVAVVTGAAGGIGAAICRRLAADGQGTVPGLPGVPSRDDRGARGLYRQHRLDGLIDTEMADWIRHDEEALERWAASIPARRIGSAREIADAVAYLASDGGSYLYGAVLMADGGVTA